MQRVGRFLIGLGVVTMGSALGNDFDKAVRRFEDPNVPAPKPVLHVDRNIHYVFITGLAGDLVPGYFKHAIEQMRELGIPASSIHLLKPPSRRPTAENADAMKQWLARIPGRIVIIGHSKGANETFAFAVQNPRFVEARVEGMYLMQASYFGSPLADELLRHKQHDLDDMTTWQRFLIEAEKVRGRFLYGIFFRRGLIGVSTREASRFMQRIMTSHPGSQALLQSRIHFITTEQKTPGLTRVILDLYGPSDGVNPIGSQMVPGWGNHLANLEGNHTDLILPGGNAARKRALATAIFTHVETEGNLAVQCPWLFVEAGL